MKKKVLAFIAVIAILVMMIPITSLATEKTENKLQVQQTTDKATYSANDDITTTLKVTNIGDFDVNFSDVVMTNLTPDGYKIKTNSKSKKEIKILKTGETATLVTIFEKDDNPGTGDDNITNILLFGGIALLALALILEIILGKIKHNNITTIIICILVAGATIFAFAKPIAAEENTDSKGKVSLATNITVDKKESAVKSSVEYIAKDINPVIASKDYVSGEETDIEVIEEDFKAHATIPENADIPEDTEKIVMVIDDTERPEAIKLDEGQDSLNVDISFYSVKGDGSKSPITDFGEGKIVSVDLSTIIPDGKELVKVFNTHNPAKPTEFTKANSKESLTEGQFFYDSAEKVMYLASSKFSPFTFVIQETAYEVIVTKDGDLSFTPVGMSLAEFRDSVNKGDYEHYNGYTVTVQRDIDLGNDEWIPIATSKAIAFKGIFDGNNKKITGLLINCTSNMDCGLFGYITEGSIVKDFTISGKVSVSYNNSGAGAIGYATGGTISGIISNLAISTTNYGRLGGIVGITNEDNRVIVKDSTFNGTIETHNGNSMVGGIIGQCMAGINIENCKNYGTLNGISASDDIGGIIGHFKREKSTAVRDLTIKDCVNLGTINHNSTSGLVGGIIGKCGGNGAHNFSADVLLINCANKGIISEKLAEGNGDIIGGIGDTAYETVRPGTLRVAGTLTVRHDKKICGNYNINYYSYPFDGDTLENYPQDVLRIIPYVNASPVSEGDYDIYTGLTE